ncbi:MAG: BrnA antitoxin family protein [Alphaproteobacteria bacterium]|nr:BrnA antitoxin family protein [Alphaproteobacteria bacterium]
MTTKKRSTESKWIDPDDAPRLDRDWFERAEIWDGDRLIRRGRPKSEAPKRATSIRLDPDVLEHYRAGGPGWQSRINETLRKAAKLRARG